MGVMLDPLFAPTEVRRPSASAPLPAALARRGDGRPFVVRYASGLRGGVDDVAARTRLDREKAQHGERRHPTLC
jgi:hypothetical protein